MKNETLKLPSYGGQALIEGVLMRGKNSVAAAMRSPEGEIIIISEDLTGIYKSNLSKIPFLRGLILLWDALGLGMRYLVKSANTQTGEDEKIEGPQLYLTLALSMLFAVALFFALPTGIGYLFEVLLKINTTASVWIESLIRAILVIGYIWAIGKMPDIARFFGYHGAEHKTINAFEAGSDMTVEDVSRYSLLHPRFGTGFLLSVVLISVIVFGILGPLPIGLRILSRIAFVPIIAMIAYEYMRWTANHSSNPIVKILIWPNLALQKLSTREPTHEMLEIAIAAFKKMMEEEQLAQDKR